jgi:hypothetical protein
MFKQPHSIRKQTIELAVDSEALALALQPRMGDVNRRHFLPVIQRVLEEFDVPGRHIRIDKLDVNLGRLPLGRFEEEGAARLYDALREALSEVLREPGGGSQPEGASRLELLEHYLLRGTLPFWAARALGPELEAFVTELAEADPDGVAALVRRLGRRTSVLERIVLCFGESLLRRLLRLLEPVHAALILAYMLDLRDVHRIEPVLPLGERPFRHMVWLLVLAYLVQDPGSQFNRKSFVKSLLEGMAAGEGLSYAEVTRTLRLALHKTKHRHPLKTSLPAVIDQLVRELDPDAATGKAEAGRAPDLARTPFAEGGAVAEEGGGTVEGAALVTPVGEPVAGGASASLTGETVAATTRKKDAAATGKPANVTTQAAVTRSREEDAPACDDALARLEQYLTAEEMAEAWTPPADGPGHGPLQSEGAPQAEITDPRGLLRLLAERDASSADQLLRRVARGTVTPSSVVVDRLLRTFSPEELLSVLMPEHGQDLLTLLDILSGVAGRQTEGTQAAQAHDGSMWRVVLAAVLREAPGRQSLSAAVRRAFELSAGRLGVSPSQLAEALERASGLDGAEAAAGLAPETRELPATHARAVRAPRPRGVKGPGRAGRPRPTEGRLRPTELARAVFARYDLSEALRYYLDHGVLPWGAVLREPALTAESVVAYLPAFTRPALRRMLTREDPAEQLRAVFRAVEKLSDGGVAKLLLSLLPRAGGDGGALLSSLPAFASEGSMRHAFYARLVVAILDGLPLDLEELSDDGPLPPAAELVLPTNPAEWEPHLLKAAVLNRLRFGDRAGAGGHTHEDLLRALLVRHPGEARHFLRAVGRVQGLRAAFVRQCPAPLLERGLQLLCPDGAASLRALALSFTRIAAPYRPLREEEARRVIIDEALHARAGEPLTADFFLRVLRRLFAVPLAERVSEVLLREAGAWAARGNLPAEHAAAFESAVRTAAAGARAPDGEPHADKERHDVEERAADFTRASVFAFLLGEGSAPRKAEPSPRGPAEPRQETLMRDALLHELERLIEESPSEVYDFISQHLTDAHRRERWVGLLPESTLVRLSHLLEPQKHRALLDAAEVLGAAWAEATPPGHPPLSGRGVLWSFLLEFLSRSAGSNRSTERFVADLFEHYAARYLSAVSGATDPARFGASMLEHATSFARAGGHASLRALLRRERALLLAPWESSAAAARPPAPEAKAAARHASQEGEAPRPVARRGRTAFSMGGDKEESAAETIYIDNAGLVLTSPFLPTFFQSLDLLGEDEGGVPRLRDREAASRAVHLLQFLVDGRTSAPEPSLVLNKILCGLPTSVAVEREIELTAAEREGCERLLKSVIANWKIIEHTSIAGLQETFFRREGRLERSDSVWKLTVQRKTLDVLVDQVPWSIAVIYQRWMSRPLYVTW